MMTNAFTAYFDDSGHPDDQAFVIVAGHIANVEQWLILEREWNETMGNGSDGKPRIFHMTELRRVERSELLPKLISIITRRVRMQLSITIRMDEYLQVNDLYALEECQGKPYALAGRLLCVMIHEWESRYNRDKLLLRTVFEDGTKHKGDLIEVMNRDEGCPIPSFESKKDVVALQSADLLAGQLLWSQKNDGNICPEFERLIDHPHNFNECTKEDLIETCKCTATPLRSQFPPGQKFSFESSPRRLRCRQLHYSKLEDRNKKGSPPGR